MTASSRPQFFYLLVSIGLLSSCFLTECRMVRQYGERNTAGIEAPKIKIGKPISVNQNNLDTAKLSGTQNKVTPPEKKDTGGVFPRANDTLKRDTALCQAEHETKKLVIALDSLRDAASNTPKGKDTGSPNQFKCCQTKLVKPTGAGKPRPTSATPKTCGGTYVVSQWWLWAEIVGTAAAIIVTVWSVRRKNKRKNGNIDNEQ